jgi:hypothetical protein
MEARDFRECEATGNRFDAWRTAGMILRADLERADPALIE